MTHGGALAPLNGAPPSFKDVPRKPGLIGLAPGNNVAMLLPTGHLGPNHKHFVLVLGYLGSYAHMGRFEAAVYGCERGPGRAPGPVIVGGRVAVGTVDGE